MRKSGTRNISRARIWEITVAKYYIRTWAVDVTDGVGRALDVLSVYDRLGVPSWDCREDSSQRTLSFRPGYLPVYCSGECGGVDGEMMKGKCGIGLCDDDWSLTPPHLETYVCKYRVGVLVFSGKMTVLGLSDPLVSDAFPPRF